MPSAGHDATTRLYTMALTHSGLPLGTTVPKTSSSTNFSTTSPIIYTPTIAR